MGVEMMDRNENAEESSFHRTCPFKCIVMAATALATLQMLTFLDKSFLGSKTTTSLRFSRSSHPTGAQSTGAMETTTNPSNPSERAASSLRFDWTNLSLTSTFARAMHAHQSDCSLPLGDLRMRNTYGLGSDLHLWTQALCNGMQENVRVQTQLPWIYLDNGLCNNNNNNSQTTAMLCYFPHSELRCPDDRAALRRTTKRKRLYFNKGMVKNECDAVQERYNASISDIRAAGIEYLFSQTSSAVVQEAKRQLDQVFGVERPSPSQLITVHIRWGDKEAEMKLRPLQEYVDAVQKLASERNLKGPEVNIFLATEDPKAVKRFRNAAKAHQWKVFVDAYFQEFHTYRDPGYNGNPIMTEQLEGRPGLVALSSALVALQANSFVLTTKSNWSRLINELRKNILDPRCDSCTQLIDLTKPSYDSRR